MPEILRILLADDDPQIRVTQPTSIVGDLEAVGITARVDPVETVEQAQDALRSRQYHCAVVDLRFNGQSGAGNEVLHTIVAEKALPVIVSSGHPDELQEQYETHRLIHAVQEKIVDEVTKKIIEWNHAKIFDFFTDDGFLASQLRTAIRRTMWEHISPRWNSLCDLPPEELQHIVARLTATVVHDQLSNDPGFAAAGGEVCIHPAEVYVFGTPRSFLSSGDVLEVDGQLFAVLTPSCDLVAREGSNAKATDVLLVACTDLATFAGATPDLAEALRAMHDPREKKSNAAKEKLEKLMRHAYLNDDGRRFFLPPFAEFKGGVIDFLQLSLRPYGAEARAALVGSRRFTLAPSIAAELATRFARYMNRLGQAPYSSQAIEDALKPLVEKLMPPVV